MSSDPRAEKAQPPFAERAQQGERGRETHMNEKPDHGEDSYVGSNRLQDKAALITGGDSGIGRAIALAYAREGADVAIGYHPDEQEDAEASAELVKAAGRRALLVPGDLADPATCRRIVEQTVAEFQRIDVLVNNAAHQGAERSKDVSPSLSEDVRESTHCLAQRLQQLLVPLRWRFQGRRRR